MPELPEVETIRLGLQQSLVGKEITGVEVFWPGVLKNLPPDDFHLRVVGDRFQSIERRGKFLLLHLVSGQTLVVHLRMTGSLIICKSKTPRPKHTHIVLNLGKRQELHFTDQRKFGEWHLLLPPELARFPGLGKLGLEPLDSTFTVKELTRILAKSTRKVKDILLDQTKIAGLGNIYADEALFLALIKPTKPANSLDRIEIVRLHAGIRRVLKASIRAQGRTFSHYRNAMGEKGDYQPLVHSSNSGHCPRCGQPIEKTRVGGRGTYFCSRCQR